MNADLKRVRESGVDDAGPGRSKKRALSSASPAPADTEDSGMEEWMKVVEVGFRLLRVDHGIRGHNSTYDGVPPILPRAWQPCALVNAAVGDLCDRVGELTSAGSPEGSDLPTDARVSPLLRRADSQSRRARGSETRP